MLERFYFERDRYRYDRDRGRYVHPMLTETTGSVYVIYDRKRGHTDPLAYARDLDVAEMIVDGLNGSVNNRPCCSTS